MSSLKKKSPYPYNDITNYEMVEEGDIHFRVISNEKGVYADIRKYFYGKPSQKGVRMPIEAFERMYKAYLKSDFGLLEDEPKEKKENEEEKKPSNNTFKRIKK